MLTSGKSAATPATPAKLEEVGDNCFLEPVDATLCGTCLVKVVVEVAGLGLGESVWMCGEDEALGAWPPLKNWPPASHEPQALQLQCMPYFRFGDGRSFLFLTDTFLPKKPIFLFVLLLLFLHRTEVPFFLT
jgi:hypothetical protein